MGNVSTFGSFTTARLGIYASQKALEVVGNNIANINTVGYTRQILNQKSLYVGGSDRYTSSMGDIRVGSGALCTGVSQLRDPYLDIRYRNELSSVGSMDSKLAGLEQLAGIFDEVGKGEDGEGFMEAQFNNLIQQLQNLVTQGAGKDDYDALVKSSSASLVKLFNSCAEQLKTLQKNQETSLRQDVDTVNDILKDIRELNTAIKKSQIHGNDALELKDERNMAIDKLSQYMKIDVSYVEEDMGGGLTVEKLVIKMAGNDPLSPTRNSVLVDGDYATQLSIAQVPDPDDPAAVIDSPNFDIALGALTNQGGNTQDGSVAVTLGDNDLHGALQSSREILTEEGEYASADDLARDPNSATKRGIPYYQNSLDSLANKFATVLNDANTMDPDVIYKKDAGGDFELDPDGNRILKDEYAYYNGGALFSNNGSGDEAGGITAANISISQSWANGKVHVLQSKEPHDTEQSTDNSNLHHILYLMKADQGYAPGDIQAGDDANSKDTPYYTGSFQGMLGHISSTLANDAKTTASMLKNHTAAANELFVNRSAVSGVDLNDEAMGMMQFQKSYSAACRLLTTMDQMLDKLINGTGVAGL